MIVLLLKSEKNDTIFVSTIASYSALVFYFPLNVDIARTTENKIIYCVFVVNTVGRTRIYRGKFRISKYVFPMTTEQAFSRTNMSIATRFLN